jgi:hypothetical protein
MVDFKYDENSSRSKFNQFLDQCPEWVQEEVWGENGLRAEIEEKDLQIESLKHSVKELCGLIDEFVHMPTDCLLKRMTIGMQRHKARLQRIELESTQE